MRKPVEVLLVEDSPGDRRLVIEALKKAHSCSSVRIAKDGIEALAILRRSGEYAEAPRPDLILLDLNLPKRDGRAVLAEIKADGVLRHIPVIVLSTSQADQDVLKSYQLGASCFITKPVDLHQFLHVISAVKLFWLDVVTLPTMQDGADTS